MLFMSAATECFSIAIYSSEPVSAYKEKALEIF